MARALEHKPKKFDDAKLAGMAPPFTVRVEKIRGNARTPIPLPDTDDGVPPGTNWGIEEVRQIEQWLVTEWSGGGLYEITVTDSSPQPQTLTWQPYWDVKLYPEKTPPPMADAASASAPAMAQPHIQPPPAPQQPLVLSQPVPRSPMPPIFPNGLPPGLPQYAQPYQQPAYYTSPPLPNAPMPGTYQWDAYQREVERRERENREREREAELKRLHDLKEKTERDAIAAQHAAALERERQANQAALAAQAAQMNELRNMVAGLASTIKETAAKPAVSPELEAMRMQLDQQKAQMERERAEREADRRERESERRDQALREEMRRQADESKRHLEEMNRRHEAALAAMNANKGPDQFMLMMQNQQREQVELAKEMSRNQLAQMQTLQAYMMNPRDIMAMAKESSGAVDHATERVTNFFGKVIETQQKVTENLLQMQPGSNAVADIVGNSLDRVGTLAERYLGGKQMEAQLAAQSQVQVAEAQARAYAQTVIAEQQRQAAPNAQSSPNMQSSGLGQPATEPRKKKKVKAQAQTPSSTEDVTMNGKPLKRLGRTDQEWFGPIMPQVIELRTNARAFIKSIEDNDLDKNGNPKGITPDNAAGMVIQAVGIVMQRQIQIPALMDLLFQDRFADFVDILLPDPIVTQQYRDEVTQAIVHHARVASGLPTDGPYDDKSQGDLDEDNEDDDDDDGDDDEMSGAADETGDDTDEPPAELVPVVALPVTKPANGQARRT